MSNVVPVSLNETPAAMKSAESDIVRKKRPLESASPPPEADSDKEDEGTKIEASATVQENGKPKRKMSKWLAYYQKKWYCVPKEAIIVDASETFECEDGKEAYKIHQCKSAQQWRAKGVNHRHFFVIKEMDHDGNAMIAWYICIKTKKDAEKDDSIVIRHVPKVVARDMHTHFLENFPASRKEKYELLLDQKPSDIAQIVPIAVGWPPVDPKNTPNVAYESVESEPRQFSAKSAAGQARGVLPHPKKLSRTAGIPIEGDEPLPQTEQVSIPYGRFFALVKDSIELATLRASSEDASR